MTNINCADNEVAVVCALNAGCSTLSCALNAAANVYWGSATLWAMLCDVQLSIPHISHWLYWWQNKSYVQIIYKTHRWFLAHYGLCVKSTPIPRNKDFSSLYNLMDFRWYLIVENRNHVPYFSYSWMKSKFCKCKCSETLCNVVRFQCLLCISNNVMAMSLCVYLGLRSWRYRCSQIPLFAKV